MNYQTASGFFHPYGDYTETVTDQAGNFYGIWAEGESKAGTGTSISRNFEGKSARLDHRYRLIQARAKRL